MPKPDDSQGTVAAASSDATAQSPLVIPKPVVRPPLRPPQVDPPELIEALSRAKQMPRTNRVFANRNLRLDRVKLVGFDMDYTLALYDQPLMEALSIKATVDKLIALKKYPAEIRGLVYDCRMGIRGLLADTETGNLIKPDRYGAPGRAYHGNQPLDRALLRDLYQRQRIRYSVERFAFIDTLFALPEAVMYGALVEFFDGVTGEKPDYAQLWRDVRQCIDLAHRDGSIKNFIAEDLPRHVQRDPYLAETLHKMRSSGKKLFLLTNSDWLYTDPVMSYLLDGAMDGYPSWRNFFDIVIVNAMKPGFFIKNTPFMVVNADGQDCQEMPDAPFERDLVYSGGNLKDFENRAGARGDRVLFVGDHIYGDILRSRKSSAWRSAMILQEMEHEISAYDKLDEQIRHLDDLERRLRDLDGDLEEKQHITRTLQKLKEGPQYPGLADAVQMAREKVDGLRAAQRAAMNEHRALEEKIDQFFNPFWGPLMKEGREVSKFGYQVEDYACLYTSRVTNFRFYSPMRHFRGPRDRMPHER